MGIKKISGLLVWVIAALWFATVQPAYAQYTDKQLYQAYLQRDMDTWKAYIDASDWTKLTDSEKIRLINYEYGYVAVEINETPAGPKARRKASHTEAQRYLDQFIAHLNAAQSILTPARYAMYMSAASAYEFMMDRSKVFSAGLQSFKLCKKAVELDPNDPMPLILKANVDFYAPKSFGGSKKAAMQEFSRAEQMFLQQGNYEYLWNFPAMQLCIAQCYEKTDDLETALKKARAILKANPDFVFLREEYIPGLEAAIKKQKKG